MRCAHNVFESGQLSPSRCQKYARIPILHRGHYFEWSKKRQSLKMSKYVDAICDTNKISFCFGYAKYVWTKKIQNIMRIEKPRFLRTATACLTSTGSWRKKLTKKRCALHPNRPSGPRYLEMKHKSIWDTSTTIFSSRHIVPLKSHLCLSSICPWTSSPEKYE